MTAGARRTSTVRVAIVGLGEAGAGLHLPALAGIPAAELVGCCDTDGGRRDRAAGKWNVPVFAGTSEMLAEVRPDVIVVATPPASHAALCVQALQAGAHVVCEKPFVSSLEEADRVIAAAVRAGRHVTVNHEFREMPIFRAVIDRAGGDRASLQFVQTWQSIDLPPWSESGWRGELVERALFEAGVHLVDLVLALFGEKPLSVSASMARGGGGGSRADAIVLATLEFSRGRLAQLTQNRISKGAPQYLELRADTDTATYRASFGGRARLSAGFFRVRLPHFRVEYGVSGIAWREEGTRRIALARNPKDPNVVATRTLLQAAFASFAAEPPPGRSAAHARDVMEVVAGCYRAAETGARVRLEPPAAAVAAAARPSG